MNYEIIKEIGAGGYGEVVEAKLPCGKSVAVKNFKANRSVEDYLGREIEALSKMDSPSIPKFVEAYERGFAMELVDGEVLCAIQEELDVCEILQVLEDVCEALVHAHEKGIVHRDVKHYNIMVREGRGVLIDFGLCVPVGEVARSSVGTPGFLAPEAIEDGGEHISSVAQDVYAFGCTISAAFGGHSPFRSEGILSTVRRCLCGEYTLPETMPESLRPIVERCIATDAADRPESMREVLEEIQRVRRALN